MLQNTSFVNPIELLGLQNLDLDRITPDLVKKAKKRLIAEITLSDGSHIHYHGRELSQNECDEVIHQLESAETSQFYHYIANNQNLNKYLTEGDETIIKDFRYDSIYNLTSFMNFVSPAIVSQQAILMENYWDDEDAEGLQRTINFTLFDKAKKKEEAFKAIAIKVKEKIEALDKMTFSIREETSEYDETNISDIEDWVYQRVDPTMINVLPEHMTHLKNEIANAIRNISVHLFNKFGDANIAMHVLDHALSIDTDEHTERKLQLDYQKITEIYERQEKENMMGPILEKYGKLIVDANTKIKSLQAKTITHSQVVKWLDDSIKPTELNSLSSEFDEIKEQIVLVLRAFSVQIWNIHNNVDSAIHLIAKAKNISGTTAKTRQELNKDYDDLFKMKLQKSDQERLRAASATRSQSSPVRTAASRDSSNSKDTDNSVVTGIVVVAILILILVGIFRSNSNTSSEYTSNPNPQATQPAPVYTPPTTSYTPPIPSYTAPIESKYKGNQLKNGASPLNTCFGSGSFSGSAWLEFDNSNASDAIVCLVNTSSERTIRNEYIRAGSTFRMSSIPTGTYYLKVYYGNDWNPKMKNFCGGNGAFESDEHFSKSEGYGDLINVDNNEYSFTTGKITLYSVANGNMSSEPTSASDFFKN